MILHFIVDKMVNNKYSIPEISTLYEQPRIIRLAALSLNSNSRDLVVKAVAFWGVLASKEGF